MEWTPHVHGFDAGVTKHLAVEAIHALVLRNFAPASQAKGPPRRSNFLLDSDSNYLRTRRKEDVTHTGVRVHSRGYLCLMMGI